MNSCVIKIASIGVYFLIAFVLSMFVCPMLVSAADNFEVILGFLLYGVALVCVGLSTYTAYDVVYEALQVVEKVDDDSKKGRGKK